MNGSGVIAAFCLLLAAAAGAAEEQDRLDRLEKRQEETERRLAESEAERAALRQEVERYTAREEGVGLGMVLRKGSVNATLQIFGDVGCSWINPDVDPRANSSFFFGGVNIFGTARVGDHFHVLSETVIKTKEEASSDTLHFDQERLYGSWAFNDMIYVKLGLEHGPVSRWNHLYHHGRWLELSIERPLLARFEGAGGILPMHNAGVEAGGAVLTGAGRIQWVLILSNGRGKVATDAQKVSDRNDGKAVEAGVNFAPVGLDGFVFGVHFRIDDIPPDPSVPARVEEIREYIFSGFLEYRVDRWDVLAEVAFMSNEDGTSGETFRHIAGYVQVGHHLNDRWTPYIRFDIRSMEQGDPYFMSLGRDLDRWEQLVGVRFELTENSAIKFEVGFGRAETRDSSGDVSPDWYTRIGLQLSWVF